MSLGDAEKALASLEGAVRREAAPSHHVARQVLLAVGQALREGALPPEFLERARQAGRAAGPAWEQAVETELTLACGEFAQSVDPRYLGLPNYDLAYTQGARERLDERLRAARELGFGLSERESKILELADRVLAEHLARKAPATKRPGPAAGA